MLSRLDRGGAGGELQRCLAARQSSLQTVAPAPRQGRLCLPFAPAAVAAVRDHAGDH